MARPDFDPAEYRKELLEKYGHEKSWELTKVGVRRWYWLVYRPRIAWSFIAELTDNDWLLAEGFAETRKEALRISQDICEKADGVYWAIRGRRDGSRPDGSYMIRSVYQRRHARKPKLSAATETRVDGDLGYLYEEKTYYNDEYGGPPPDWEPWEKHPITKLTAKRAYIRRDFGCPGHRQLSFDSAALDQARGVRRGSYYGAPHYFSEAGKAAYEQAEADRRREREERDRADWQQWFPGKPYPEERAESFRDPRRGGRQFPLLGLSTPFSKKDVIRSFRRRSLELHPDQGGDASRFIELMNEKDRALKVCAEARKS